MVNGLQSLQRLDQGLRRRLPARTRSKKLRLVGAVVGSACTFEDGPGSPLASSGRRERAFAFLPGFVHLVEADSPAVQNLRSRLESGEPTSLQ